jgi:hypothetical protein
LSKSDFEFCYEADDLAAKKTRLKQWAKMVACVAQQSSQISASGHSDQE